ncbi:MAG TPA: hypothetical protein VFS43_46890 [Polyangiaceae bacterium]|nr:hypothetical protein [Polyangiaceae bacterium]
MSVGRLGRLARLSVVATLATPAAARAAPMGHGVEPVAVLALASDLDDDFAQKTLTNAVRQAVLDGPQYALSGDSPPLVATAAELKCKLGGRDSLLPDERSFDDACLKKLARRLDVRRVFWGFVTAREGKPVVRLHLWQQGQGDRVASLPYDPTQRDRIAERLYKKLVTPTAVGDVALSGAGAGELFVDGRPAGPYADSIELTLETGLHDLELRRGGRTIAWTRVRIEPGGRSEARLAPVAETAPPSNPPPALPRDPPPVTIRPRLSAWPWVLGGAAAAGLTASGVFWALRLDAKSELRRACADGTCPDRERATLDRGERYTALAGVSLGIGIAAGVGLGAYLLTSRRARPVAGVVVPLPGGGAVGVAGAF